MRVNIEWTLLNERDRKWRTNRCLYLYLDETGQLLYIGKAYSATILRRLEGSHKENLLSRLKSKLGFGPDWKPMVLHGRLTTDPGRRVTKPVFRDVESLLIKRLKPRFNTNCKGIRIQRPGLIVECDAAWPFNRRRFRDVPDEGQTTLGDAP
jgi:hypothetical protein